MGRQESMLTHLPPDYVEKLQLQIPDYLSKLLMDVTFALLDKGGYKRPDAEKIAALIGKSERKEYEGMFEAVIESMKEAQQEAWEEGVRQEKLQTAANFKKLGVSTDIIMKATGLSPEEIEGMASKYRSYE